MKAKKATTASKKPVNTAAPSDGALDAELKRVRELAKLMKQLDVAELEIETRDAHLRLRRDGGGFAPTAHALSSGPSLAPPPIAAPAPEAATTAPADDPNVVFVTSPFVGTFYRSPSPDQPPFVDVGQSFRRGQVLCIVEAMKLMNEIEAELAGTVVEVLIDNGQTVEYGDRLFKVRKSG